MPVVTSASTISFPTSTLSDHPMSPQLTGVYPNLPSISNESYARTSKSSLRASALEVHDLVWLASSRNVQGRLNQLYESNAVYKNTFVTATSLPIIRDIHSLTHRLCDVRIPKPTALIARILGYQATESQMWVAWRIWSEIGTVCETESFDGHRKSIIEHTVHFLLLGGSLHRSVRMHTILSFNEQGRITHHQDICDLRELLYLIPGGHAVQFVTTRFAAIGLAGLSRLGSVFSRSTDSMWDVSHADPGPQPDNVAKRRMNASEPGNVFGMSHSQREYSHAPDTDSV
ncbi:hypothetical protein RSOLAG22IIIB_03779 [Rhizoctonia solani]|uniref:Uncharacterized protein n=1 Tax=Rhizoctonia solani TaxID=456999 RepID=A0A0K6FS80_9AGAM|nr:hypothetical protein RSOLAG22IIIB_03779 [Rhizoctonia solani]